MARALAPRCRLDAAWGGRYIVTTDKRSIDVHELGSLLAATGQNCHQFPRIHAGRINAAIDEAKLQRALDFSDIAVAIYVKGRAIPGGDYIERIWKPEEQGKVWGGIFSDKGPRCLVAFGRAVSDKTLAGSIHDVVVAPSMQRRGLGRHVLQHLTRYMYYTQDIADISVLTCPENMPFFASCGFKPDALCSTTMLYTKSPPVNSKTHHETTQAGRMSLLVPALGYLRRRSAHAIKQCDCDRCKASSSSRSSGKKKFSKRSGRSEGNKER